MSNTEQWRLWLAELRRWVHRCLAMKEVWQVRVLGEHWVCPYCARVTALDGDEDSQLTQIVEHLVDACKGFQEIGVPPRTTPEQLQHKALGFYVKKRLTSSAAWQMRDAGGHWICPYCTHASDVRIAGRLDKATLQAIVGHVGGCEVYIERGLDGFQSVDEIKAASAKRVSLQQSIEELTSWMTDE